MWVRGLKLTTEDSLSERLWVAPYVGAWIETMLSVRTKWDNLVAPYVGAWIETSPCVLSNMRDRRTLCGCVD